MKVSKLLKEGLKKIQEQHIEDDTPGRLRGGSVGHLDEEGNATGTCMRQAHLRYKGYSYEEHPLSSLIMFSGGVGSEEIQCKSLDALGLKYLREEQVPICWTTKNGITVTGRPDIVLVDENGVPYHGIELKMASTVWTSKAVRFDKEPKLSHVIQAAHYSWQLGIPFSLVYIQYVKFSVPRGAKWIPSTPLKDKEGLIQWKGNWGQYIQPFIVEYEIFFDNDGRVWYETEDGTSHETIITRQGIERFYEEAHKEKLHPRPAPKTLSGAKAGYTLCDYCPLKDTCDLVEEKNLTYDDWLMLIEARPDTTIKLSTESPDEVGLSGDHNQSAKRR